MIIVATYTANLASFLISSASVKLSVANINDANTRSASTCVIGSSQVIINLLKASYPGVGLRIIKGTDVSNVLTLVGAGQCDCAVVYQSDWDNYRNNAIINPGCGMIPVGGTIIKYNGAWVYNADYNRNCTAILGSAINSLISGISGDGTMSKIIEKNRGLIATQQCSLLPIATSFTPLDFTGMTGLYIVFFGICGIAVMLSVSKVILARRGFYPKVLKLYPLHCYRIPPSRVLVFLQEIVESRLRKISQKFTSVRTAYDGNEALSSAPDRDLADVYGVAGGGGEKSYVEGTTYAVNGIATEEPVAPVAPVAYGAPFGGRPSLPAPPVVTTPALTAGAGDRLIDWHLEGGLDANPNPPASTFRSPRGADAAPTAAPGAGSGWTMFSPARAAGAGTTAPGTTSPFGLY